MDADVIVIGAGVAGLAAARQLARQGLRVVVLEARDRAGGRIVTERAPGLRVPIELGAEFVHGGNGLLRAALRQAGMKMEHVRRDMWSYEGGEIRRQHGYWRELKRVAAHIPTGTKQSFAAFLRRERRLDAHERQRLLAFAEGFNAAPAGRMSAEVIRADRGGVDTPQSRPGRQGYRGLVEELVRQVEAAAGDLRFRTPVTEVRWRRGAVTAQARDRSFHAPAAVITLPLGVLQADAVRFVPALREKGRIIRRLGWGQVMRVTLRFAPGFWSSEVIPAALRRQGRANFGFFTAPETQVPTWWAPDPNQPVLVGWCGGPPAEALLKLNRRTAVNRAVHSLAEAWQQPVIKLHGQLRGGWMHNWRTDPWARGAYSYAVAGHEHGPGQLAKPVAGTLFFAGEATAEELGTVHGAMASGVRAAQEIAGVFRRRPRRP